MTTTTQIPASALTLLTYSSKNIATDQPAPPSFTLSAKLYSSKTSTASTYRQLGVFSVKLLHSQEVPPRDRIRMLYIATFVVFSVFLLYIFLAVRIPKNVLRSVNKVRIAANWRPIGYLQQGMYAIGASPIAQSMPGRCTQSTTGFQWFRNDGVVITSEDKIKKVWKKRARYNGPSKGVFELPHTFSTAVFSFLFDHKIMYRRYQPTLF